MKTLIKRIRIAAALAVLLALSVGNAWAVAPKAVWNGDFGTTTKGGVTLNLNGHSVSDGVITIQNSTDNPTAEGYKGIYIDLPQSTNGITVIVKYSGLVKGTYGKVLGASCVNSEYDRTGIRLTTYSTLAGCWNSSESSGTLESNGTASGSIKESGYMAFTYGSGGTYIYTNGLSNASFASAWASTALKAEGDSTNNKICGATIGGSRRSVDGWTAAYGMKISAIAVFDGALTVAQLNAYRFPNSTYLNWWYADPARVLTWTGTAEDTHTANTTTYKLFDLEAGADTSTTYTFKTDSEASWHLLCYTSKADNQGYTAPGTVLRFADGEYTKSIGSGFSPLTLGGMIVEASGYSFDSENRSDIFGDPTGNAETWFSFSESFTDNRTGGAYLVGTVNIDVASGKTFELKENATIYASAEKGQGALGIGTAGGMLKMHGAGTFKVKSLTASGATLDYSDTTAMPFIDGDLTIDNDTQFVFPSTLAAGSTYTLCSGTLSGATDGIRQITVGNEVKTVPLTFSGNTVTYAEATIYTATVSGTTVTWDGGNAPESYDSVSIVFSGSGTVAGLSGTDTTISAGSDVTVDITNFTNPVLEGAGTFRYTSGYPTTVPAATYSYEYVGGATEDAKVTVTSALTINGSLKTSGYLALTGANVLAASGSFEVLSEKTELAAVEGSEDNNWSGGLGGDITVDANATLVALNNDALTRSGSLVTITVYGTLAFGNYRWTMQSSAYHKLVLHGTAQVTGAGDGNGILDFENANASATNIDVYDGTPTISGPVCFRAKTIAWVNSSATLTLSGGTSTTYDNNGELAKSGPGTLKFSTVAPTTTGGLSASEGTIALDNVSYTAGTVTLSSGSDAPTLKMIATDAETTVSATVNVPASTRGCLAFEGNGTFDLTGPNTAGNIVWLNAASNPGTLRPNNVTINNGSTLGNYTFNKVAGSGNLNLAAWAGNYDKDGGAGLTYTISTIDADDYSGTIALSNNGDYADGQNSTFKFSVGNIEAADPAYGSPLVKVTTNIAARTHTGTTTINVDLASTTLNGETAKLFYDANDSGFEGIYRVAAEVVDASTSPYTTNAYKSVSAAIAAAADSQTKFVVPYVNETISTDIGRVIVEPNENVTITFNCTSPGHGYNSGSMFGYIQYSKAPVASTFVWVGTTDSTWTTASNWTIGGVPAGRAPNNPGDTVVINAAASFTLATSTSTIFGIQIGAAVYFAAVDPEAGTTVNVGNDGIVLTDASAQISTSGVTLGATPTTTVADSYVKFENSTYSVAAKKTITLTMGANVTSVSGVTNGQKVAPGETFTVSVGVPQYYTPSVTVTGATEEAGTYTVGDSDVTVSVTAMLDTYTITIPSVANTTVSVSYVSGGASQTATAAGDITVDAGTSLTATWTAASGYRITAGASQTINSVAAAQTLAEPTVVANAVTFGGYTVEYTADYTKAATISATVSGEGAAGATYTLTAGGNDYNGTYNAGTVTFSNVTAPSLGSELSYTISASGAATGTSGAQTETVGNVTSGWVQEDATHNTTGTWETDITYSEGVATITDNTYTPTKPGDGIVTLTTVVKFGDDADPEVAVGAAQAALRVQNGVFEVYGKTTSEGAAGWQTTVVPADSETVYTVTLTINYPAKTFTASVQASGAGSPTQLGGTWYLATDADKVSQIAYKGTGEFTSLVGSFISSDIEVTVDTEDEVSVSGDFISRYLGGETISAATALLAPDSTTPASNGYNYFSNYALGLDPRDADDKPTIKVETNSEGKFVVTLVDGDGDPIVGAANVALTLKFQSGTDPNSLTTETISSFSEGSATIDPSTMEGNVQYYKVRIDIGAK